jgi:hypothetical protein
MCINHNSQNTSQPNDLTCPAVNKHEKDWYFNTALLHFLCPHPIEGFGAAKFFFCTSNNYQIYFFFTSGSFQFSQFKERCISTLLLEA